MQIELHKISRRFNREWIFRDIDFVFERHSATAVLGPNGSGKSTLLQILSGLLSPSSGHISFLLSGKPVPAELVFKQLSIAAPYLELPEEMTLSELISFHFSFKRLLPGITPSSMIELAGLEKAAAKQLRYYSSGMKQRVKLLLSFCSDTPLLLLDEPCSNLDQHGIAWYHNLVERFGKDRTLVVCSNQENEYSFCSAELRIQEYK